MPLYFEPLLIPTSTRTQHVAITLEGYEFDAHIGFYDYDYMHSLPTPPLAAHFKMTLFTSVASGFGTNIGHVLNYFSHHPFPTTIYNRCYVVLTPHGSVSIHLRFPENC